MSKKLIITKDVDDPIDAPVLERAIVDIAIGDAQSAQWRVDSQSNHCSDCVPFKSPHARR